MPDYAALLARLDGPEPMRAHPFGIVYEMPRWRSEWTLERAECAAAIRALMAENKTALEALDAMTQLAKPGVAASMIDIERSIRVAVGAERGACAEVCKKVAELYRDAGEYDLGAEHALEHAAAEIRARGRGDA